MTVEKVLGLYNWFNQNGIAVWIDGGWGVDALLGRQTREHDDLDIAVQHRDNVPLRHLLESNGYHEEERFDSCEFMYVMKNEIAEQIDIHVFEYDENGNNTYGIEYSFGSLTGTGVIGNQKVNCIDAGFMFQFKMGYAPSDKDTADVRALSENFSFALANQYIQTTMTDLTKIPGIGKNMAQHLTAAEYPDIAALKGQNPEEVYTKNCLAQGVQVDHCALYCYRLAVHFADHDGQLPPDQQSWWDWKD